MTRYYVNTVHVLVAVPDTSLDGDAYASDVISAHFTDNGVEPDGSGVLDWGYARPGVGTMDAGWIEVPADEVADAQGCIYDEGSGAFYRFIPGAMERAGI